MVVHSFLSFKTIIKSVASGGIGSDGISPLPVFPTTALTSGNSFINLDACILVVILCESDVPCGILNSKAKSPSSNCGINSPPIFEKMKPVIINNANAAATTILRYLIAPFIRGSYPL